MTVRKALHNPVPKAALPEFTPVPRKQPRHDGWTPERQRAVIEALADTGCVAIACRMVNMSQPSFYQLRRQPGAESFRAAAEAAQTLGLQPVKDEAFQRAMHGELIPVFVAGKLMGFRRKKNDRLLMFILRHYGQDAAGRRTTINYFSTRATAGAASAPSPHGGEGRGEGESAGSSAMLRPDCPRQSWNMPGACSTGASLAKAEATTTTVKTVINGTPNAPTRLTTDTEAANVLNAFEGVELDAEAQAEIQRSLEACAERRRALEATPEHDPERFFIGEAETNGYLGQLESGVEGEDFIPFKPGEPSWESIGEPVPEWFTQWQEREDARQAAKALPAPDPELPSPLRGSEPPLALSGGQGCGPDGPGEGAAKPKSKPRKSYKPRTPKAEARQAKARRRESAAGHEQEPGSAGQPAPQATGLTSRSMVRDGPTHSPEKPKRTYKPRKPKPRFTPPDDKRKAKAIKQVEADRREAATAEAERRKRGNRSATLS